MLLVLGALPWVFLNDLRPLVGRGNIFRSDRNSLYFRAQASEQASYVGAVDFVAESSSGACREVGVYMDVNDPEYLLWVLLQQKVGGNILLELVDVQNISIRASGNFPQFTPCAIFVVNPPPPGGFEMGGRLYRPAWTSEVLSVFLAR